MHRLNGQFVETDLVQRIPRRIWPAFHALLRARDCAATSSSEIWEFAVELSVLCEIVDRTDLRWLVKSGLLSHAYETTGSTDAARRFAKSAALRFTKCSCFVLSERGITLAQAIASSSQRREDVRPSWDDCCQKLWLGDVLVKHFRVPSQNQVAILAAFEEEDWPARIYDPLSPHPDISAKRRLHDTIKGLNRNQKIPVMRFLGDGTGEAVLWETMDYHMSSNGAAHSLAIEPSEC